jgi:hypothetical protein
MRRLSYYDCYVRRIEGRCCCNAEVRAAPVGFGEVATHWSEEHQQAVAQCLEIEVYRASKAAEAAFHDTMREKHLNNDQELKSRNSLNLRTELILQFNYFGKPEVYFCCHHSELITQMDCPDNFSTRISELLCYTRQVLIGVTYDHPWFPGLDVIRYHSFRIPQWIFSNCYQMKNHTIDKHRRLVNVHSCFCSKMVYNKPTVEKQLDTIAEQAGAHWRQTAFRQRFEWCEPNANDCWRPRNMYRLWTANRLCIERGQFNRRSSGQMDTTGPEAQARMLDVMEDTNWSIII